MPAGKGRGYKGTYGGMTLILVIVLALFCISVICAPVCTSPYHDSHYWSDDFEYDDAGMALLDNAVRNPGDYHIRGQVNLLGRADYNYSFDTCALACDPDNGVIYGGTMGNPPNGKALLFRYDPDKAWTDDDHQQPDSNPRILGEPFSHVDWVDGSDLWIWDVLVHDGKVYGGAYNWKETPEYHNECRAKGGRVFVYDPNLPWTDDNHQQPDSNPRDLGQAVPGPDGHLELGEAGVLGMCVGNDGMIYGGTISSSIKYKEAPPAGVGGHIFRFDPDSPDPEMEDLGEIDAANVEMVWSMTPHPDTDTDVLYVGTANGARVYELDTIAESGVYLGRLEEADYGYASEMLTGLDGRIYIGSYPTCHLGIYDPESHAMVYNDTVLDNQRELPGLTNGNDGYIYMATYGHSRLSGYVDGSLLRLDPGSDTIESLGPAVCIDPEYGPYTPLYWVDGLCTGVNGHIYGAGYGTFMMEYDPAHVYDGECEATSVCVYPSVAVWGQVIPRPNSVNARQRITGLTPASDGKIYGGTFVEWWGHPEHSLERGGRLFYYRPVDELGQGDYQDLGQAIDTEYGVWAPIEGPDGAIYFGTEPNGHLGRYLPSGVFEDLGIPLDQGECVRSLTFHGDVLYGGTDPLAYLFSYDTGSGEMEMLGRPMSGRSVIGGLLEGEDGLIYGTCGPGLYLFVYDPDRAWDPGEEAASNPRCLDVPGDESHSYALAWGPDDQVYISTYPGGRVYAYDTATGVIDETPDYTNPNPEICKGILDMVRGSDGKLYGGTEYEDVFMEDHELLIRYEDGTYYTMPCVCGWEDAVTAVTCGANGRIYGGTGPFGYLFEYDPGFMYDWDQASYTAQTPGATNIQVDVLDVGSNTLRENISDVEDISALSPDSPALRLRVGMSTLDDGMTPRLESWTLSWTPSEEEPQLSAMVEEDGDGDVYWGELVELQGDHFGAGKGSSSVEFAGTAAVDCRSWSDESIEIVVPEGCAGGDVTVTVMGNASNGIPYTLTDPPLDHFRVEAPAGAVAGTPFDLTVSARDMWDGLIPSYSGPADLSDTTGTISPDSATGFSGGTWSGQMTITEAA
ncbi:MAG: hypothetical protein SWK76_16640, partial [Actinomycetota bacterium]|nr:hypothetical protein [Actinomycetota bacterium]